MNSELTSTSQQGEAQEEEGVNVPWPLRMLVVCVGLAVAVAYLVKLWHTGQISTWLGISMVRTGGWVWQLNSEWVYWLQNGALLLLLGLFVLGLARGWQPGVWLRGAAARTAVAGLLFWLVLQTALMDLLHGALPPAELQLVLVPISLLAAYVCVRWPERAARTPQAHAREKMGGLRRGEWVLIALAGCVATLVSMIYVYEWYPICLDSESQIAQARVVAGGSFTLPMPAELRDVVVFPLAVLGPQEYVQYPPGYIMPLAAVIRLHLPLHTLDVICGGIVALLTAWLAVEFAPAVQRRAAAWLAVLLLCASPFFQVLSGSMMNHLWTTMLLLGAFLCLWRAGVRLLCGGRSTAWLLAGGLLLGGGISTRPLTGAVHIMFWGICAAWLLVTVWRRTHAPGPVLRTLGTLWPAGLGLGVMAFCFCFYNWKTTGHPFVMGYSVRDPAEHRLGFVPDSEGHSFTPTDAVNNLAANLVSYNAQLLGWSCGSLLPLLLWWLARRWPARNLLLVGLFLLQAVAYFFYHFLELFFGPRFWFEVTPLMIVGAALGLAPALVRGGWGARILRLALVLASGGALLWGISFWQNHHERTIERHRNLAKLMRANAEIRPLAIAIWPPIAEMAGTWLLGDARGPVWFVQWDQFSQAHKLPFFAKYHWIYFDGRSPKPSASTGLMGGDPTEGGRIK